jgi:5'-3' exonuclease
MGIPAFFSFIIKNYPSIVRNLNYHNENCTDFDNLFMDCNSIIYDIYNGLIKNEDMLRLDTEEFEIFLIRKVIEKIEYYIKKVSPKNTVYIAFDGVAPFAKMEQQRVRRYKSNFMSNINDNTKSFWNTTAITPGTRFMRHLSMEIELAFKGEEIKYNVKKMMVSCSNEPGEGEHKLFQYIRTAKNMATENIFVYGLDSDLIMLSIFHCEMCKNIYVFRESPDFIKSVGNLTFATNDLLFLDIGCLSKYILVEMACNSCDKRRIYDYIFICFLLGNDFLPHFPSLNIRTNGVQIILNTYRSVIGNFPERFFISIENNRIQWKWVKVFITELSKTEQGNFIGEYVLRNKMDKYQWSYSTKEEKENVILNTPIIYRTDEKYICPTEKGWQERYYNSLFSCVKTHDNIQKICINYMEGLEWVFKYYTNECPDWKWKYNYHYAPLLVDLCRYIPDNPKDFIYSGYATNMPFQSFIQLLYVVPPENHYLIESKVVNFINEKYSGLITNHLEFKWAFCRYFWESHVVLKEVSVGTLEKIEREVMQLYHSTWACL